MTLSLIVFCAIALLLLVLLLWLSRDSAPLQPTDPDASSPDELGRRHVTYFPQVRQAMAATDLAFLTSRGSHQIARRVRRERRRIVLSYLSCLRSDFARLWKLARIIASLSPKVSAAQEFARLRLGLAFYTRYQLLRFKFTFGFAPLPDLSALSEAVGRFALQLETAMNQLGERAALAAELASTLNRSGLNTP